MQKNYKNEEMNRKLVGGLLENTKIDLIQNMVVGYCSKYDGGGILLKILWWWDIVNISSLNHGL